jgi:hypothetical protein
LLRGAVIWVIPASQNPWSEQLIPKNRAQFRNALTGCQEPVCPIGARGLGNNKRPVVPNTYREEATSSSIFRSSPASADWSLLISVQPYHFTATDVRLSGASAAAASNVALMQHVEGIAPRGLIQSI